ncbi:MAG TPA: hypothetical protein VM658_20635 [bacterium]|nr:hypothetical protein [bacterium]
MNDPIVAEVRKHRMEHTRKFNGDLAAICEDLRKVQQNSGHKIVRLRPALRKSGQGSERRAARQARGK